MGDSNPNQRSVLQELDRDRFPFVILHLGAGLLDLGTGDHFLGNDHLELVLASLGPAKFDHRVFHGDLARKRGEVAVAHLHLDRMRPQVTVLEPDGTSGEIGQEPIEPGGVARPAARRPWIRTVDTTH